ncbi:hypothetical protein CkaCkLH20_08264 [Colletotrichum karsti]|uniref:Monooxygenase n=1 Tax=Colletotrichum karsti TaxID=1095194 RepID=A0A9P6I5B9_9PEZI|nr:uncharacterized protein CkaCkLH20_08264 [Colletotrichum karsti]KAF9874281.1 hypothetical protein CkaCkLH20_08264 [Colletotrichum karsti]
MSSPMDTFRGILKPTSSPYTLPKINSVPLLIKDGFTLTTLFTIGAIMQTLLFLVLPTKYAIIPCSALALNSIISTITGTRSKSSNPYLNGVVRGRTSAQFPDPATGTIPATPAGRPVLVFHLGVRFNHPLGMLSPGGRQLGEYFTTMNDDLDRRADEYGLYHMSSWSSLEAERNNTLMFIYYFRDVAGLNRFAHDPLHRRTWDWFNGIRAEFTHIGIFHEGFVSGAQQYETIYDNMKPTLLGAASVKCDNEETKEEEWVNTLVSADNSALRSQFKRMGKATRNMIEYDY